MSDLIERQAAIDVADAVWSVTGDKNVAKVWDQIKDLPSAQPEMNFDEWCTDCKEYDQERHCCPRFNRVIRQTLKDAQFEIVRCKDCRWRKDQSGSTAWLPCRAIVTPSDFYCSFAERRTDDRSD